MNYNKNRQTEKRKKCPQCNTWKNKRISFALISSGYYDSYCFECRTNLMRIKRYGSLEMFKTERCLPKLKKRLYKKYLSQKYGTHFRCKICNVVFDNIKKYNGRNECKPCGKKRASNYYSKRHKERCNIDELYKLKASIRANIGQSFRKKGYTKKSKTFEILGCDWKVFKKHIERQFKDGMNWENYGKYGWHLDHIIPISSAKTEGEIYKLNHYTNFQPLWWNENISKNGKIIEGTQVKLRI